MRNQVERLGMGGSGHRGVSHSAMSDMSNINQETPTNLYGGRNISDNFYSSKGSGGGGGGGGRGNRDDDDDFEIVGGSGAFFSGPPRYESAFAKESKSEYSNRSNWDTSDDNTTSGNTMQDIVSTDRGTAGRGGDEMGRSRKAYEVSDGTDAQKKFGNAKSISSDAFFGSDRDVDFETKQNLRKYEGNSSISSAEFFGNGGDGKPGGGGRKTSYSQSAGHDMSDIKEGVRQGVSKVAGRLSNLASGVMSSIQNNYG